MKGVGGVPMLRDAMDKEGGERLDEGQGRDAHATVGESFVGGHRRGGLAGLWCWLSPFGRLRNFYWEEGYVGSRWWLDMGDETGIIGGWRD